MPRLTFEIVVPPDPERQHVVVAGTDPALGNWQPERGLVLDRGEDGRFRGAVDLPCELVEFKITRGSWDNEETNIDGTPVLNYQALVAHDVALVIEVEHWKDSPPVDPEAIHGKTIEIELDANLLGHSRRAMVWLPPGFMRSQDSKHPVLYLLDGQDSLSALSSPDNETLAAEDWVRRLAPQGLMTEVILVAVFHREDFGQRDDELSPQCDGPRMADFLVNDLKPFIDYTFCRDRTLSDPANTGLMGFGLAGALTLWMAMRHAQSFGRFACLSPSYEDLSADPPEDCELLKHLAADKSFKPRGRKLYFDHGTVCGDRSVGLYQERVNATLKEKGFVEGKDYLVNIALGADHSITAWRARLAAPLMFLFGASA